MKKKLVTFLATCAYTGLSPVMPGTIGTLWGVGLAFILSTATLYLQAAVMLMVISASVYLAGETSRQTGEEDPKSVVCDEVAGYLVSIFLIPFTAFNAILVFLLFRFFDILKPCPVGYLDRTVKDGFGIVLDDVAAGVYANISAEIIIWALRFWSGT